MHSLHKILVNLKQFGPATPEELIRNARLRAEAETSEYADTAFDWRDTATAGRWAEEYPVNVMLGGSEPERIVKELEEAKSLQEGEMNEHFDNLGKAATCSLVDLKKAVFEHEEIAGKSSTRFSSVGYSLKCIGRLLSGDYYFSSYFYDTDSYTALITQETIQKVNACPSDWALVFFDYHY